MSATEELRRLLDERGIEHDDEFIKSALSYCDGYEATYWNGDSFGYVEPIGAPPGTIGSYPDLTINNCTPEQAIAATLGRGECEMEYVSDFMSWHCKACDMMDMAPHNPKPRYCKWCGAKVVDA